MRTLTQTFQDAINNVGGINYHWRLTVYKSYAQITDSFVNHIPSGKTSTSGIDYDKNHQALMERVYSAYGNTYRDYYTVYPDTGVIKIAKSTSATPYVTALGQDDAGRPGVFGNRLFLTQDAVINIHDLDLSNFPSSVGSTLIETQMADQTGVCYPVSATEFIFVSMVEGGYKIWLNYYDTNTSIWLTHECPSRIMIPNYALNPTKDIHYLNFAGAAKTSYGIFFYISMIDGSIMGVRFNPNGVWEDPFTAIPSDLSLFVISNVTARDDRIFIMGQFQYTGDFNNSTVFNLMPWSDDGETFSVDRFIGLTTNGAPYNVFIATGGDPCNMWLSDMNSNYLYHAPYIVAKENAERYVIQDNQIHQVSGDIANTLTIELANGEEWFDDRVVNLDTGNMCFLEVGVTASGFVEWMGYLRCVIAKRSVKYPSRGFSIDVAQEGMWRNSVMTYPWYLEINSKSSVRDDISNLNHGSLVSLTTTAGVPEPLAFDFWNEKNGFEGGGLAGGSHGIDASNTYYVGDLTSKGLTSYPMIPGFPFDVKIYGWSRIGYPSTNPNTADNTSKDLHNDDFQVVFIVQSVTPEITQGGVTGYTPVTIGPSRTITIPLTAKKSGTTTYPPQSWKTNSDGTPVARYASGSLPVTYTIDQTLATSLALTIADQIVDIGVICASDDHAPCVNYVERVEIPAIQMNVDMTDQKIQVVQETIPGNGGFPAYGTILQEMYVSNPVSIPCQVGYHYVVENMPGELYYSISNDGGGTWYHRDWIIPWATDEASTWQDGYAKGFTPQAGWNMMLKAERGNQYTVHVQLRSGNVYVPATPDVVINKAQVLAKGTPITMLSAVPFTTFNFEAGCESSFTGTGSRVGVVGLASDDKNYVMGRITDTTAEICKVRKSIVTVLASVAISRNTSVNAKLLFTHKNGHFELRLANGSVWGLPILTYDWTFNDGPLCINKDILHVGIYAMIDVPHFRIFGFKPSSSSVISLLPGYDAGAIASFPSSGTVNISGSKYTYTGKSLTAKVPRGPFQERAAGTWNSRNPDDHYQPTNKPKDEPTFLDWKNNNIYHSEWNGYVLADSNGSDDIITDVDHKAWITTGGQVVWLINRMRVYTTKGMNAPSTYDKLAMTHGLTGVKPVVVAGATTDPSSLFYEEGTYCFQDSNNCIEFIDFFASSGNKIVVIEDMMEQITRLAGGKAIFPGDYTRSSFNFGSGTLAIQ